LSDLISRSRSRAGKGTLIGLPITKIVHQDRDRSDVRDQAPALIPNLGIIIVLDRPKQAVEVLLGDVSKAPNRISLYFSEVGKRRLIRGGWLCRVAIAVPARKRTFSPRRAKRRGFLYDVVHC
jgi:hypothetical protein